MRRDLIIGILVSIALHGGVAWLGSGHNPPPPPPPKPPEIKVVFIPPVPPDEPPPEVSTDASKQPVDVAPPMLPDVPLATVPPDAFKQTIQPPPPDSPNIGLGAIAIPKGHIGLQGMAIFDAKDLDQPLVVRSQPDPEYPTELKREGVTGSVMVMFLVDSNGDVRDVRVLSSTRVEFEEPAKRAALRWKFKPPTRNGKPVGTHAQTKINFTLNDGDN